MGSQKFLIILFIFQTCYSQVSTPMESSKQLASKIEKGILEEHINQEPLLERIELGKRGKCISTRTYSDGTHYLLSYNSMKRNFSEDSLSWRILACIQPAGIKIIQNTLNNEVYPNLEKYAKDISNPLNPKKIYWKGTDDINGVFSFITPGGSYEQLPVFVKVLDEAVSLNAEKY